MNQGHPLVLQVLENQIVLFDLLNPQLLQNITFFLNITPILFQQPLIFLEKHLPSLQSSPILFLQLSYLFI